MNKAYKKLVGIIFLAFCFGNVALAINSEFKNTLTGVDITKTGDENYNINLYTSKTFSSPVKVIKKSDLNYYILLPETKSSVSKVNTTSSDIRKIDTAMYPYAGIDVNNGYTKININTTKPINFNVVTRNVAQKTTNTTNIATVQNSTKEEKVQKKNSDFLQKKDSLKEDVKPKETVNIAKSNDAKTIKKAVSENSTKSLNIKPQKTEVKKSVESAVKNNGVVSLKEKSVDKKVEKVEKEVKKGTEAKVETKVENKIETKPIKTMVAQSSTKPAKADIMAAAKITPEETIKQEDAESIEKTEVKKAKTNPIKKDYLKRAKAKLKRIKNGVARRIDNRIAQAKKDWAVQQEIKKQEQELKKQEQEIKKQEQKLRKQEQARKEAELKAKEEAEQERLLQQEAKRQEIERLAQAEKIAKEENNLAEALVQTEENIEESDTENTEEIANDNQEKLISKQISLSAIFNKFKNSASNKYERLSEKLLEYGLTVFDLIFIIFAGIFSFIFILFIASRKQNQPKLKNKAELLDKKEPSLVPKKEEKQEAKGQYFVFENNIKQTELTDPAVAQEKKNFELVSYDPDIMINSTSDSKDGEDDDLDIIQKILKEDSFVDIETTKESNEQKVDEKAVIESTVRSTEQAVKETVKESSEQTTSKISEEPAKVITNEPGRETVKEIVQEQTKETIKEPSLEPVRQNETVTSPIGFERVQKEEPKQIQNENEPVLLNSVEIAPEQGFMLISYNNKISLMGYIHDDVFVLHNYKTSKPSSYDIQQRLVDKDNMVNVYIVKAQGVKLLVKATNTTMNTEIIL